ncbi:MAG: hypothetical protein OEZ01_16430 [Candidatus Heimdallarchaeota archaeon]|nr:hypothetical protein [Candidatus Heimdallarchaeota archaeon]MDH5647599.1 hypothetical protein [Candidatus Heimdallarchaeota archaeon]
MIIGDREKVDLVIKKLQKSNRIMEDLIDLAMTDKKLSEDEKQILFSINKNLELYARGILEAISDGKVTPEELEGLKEIENNIILEAQEIAEKDAVISGEEMKLIHSLISEIKELSNL